MNDFEKLVSFLQQAQVLTKIFHWKTNSFSQHEALDELSKVLIQYTDMIAEASIGIEPEAMLNLQPANHEMPTSDVKAFMSYIIENLVELIKPVSEVSGALESTTDDMMQGIYTVNYKIQQLS